MSQANFSVLHYGNKNICLSLIRIKRLWPLISLTFMLDFLLELIHCVKDTRNLPPYPVNDLSRFNLIYRPNQAAVKWFCHFSIIIKTQKASLKDTVCCGLISSSFIIFRSCLFLRVTVKKEQFLFKRKERSQNTQRISPFDY